MYNSNLNWAPMNNAPNTWDGYTNPYRTVTPTGNRIGYSPMQPQPMNNLLRVTGPESAKAYSLPPNSNVVLFDADNPIFYLKATDDSGFATIRTFEFNEKIDTNVGISSSDIFATKEDLSSVADRLSSIEELLKGLVD